MSYKKKRLIVTVCNNGGISRLTGKSKSTNTLFI